MIEWEIGSWHYKKKTRGQVTAVVRGEEEDHLSGKSESTCEKEEMFKNLKGKDIWSED